MQKKAISLLSGGLDSAIATKLIQEQGIEVVGLHFTSPFSSRKESEQGAMAIKTANELGIKLIVKEKGDDYIDIVMNPRHGYGKNMNPCIDCRIYMLKKAKEFLNQENACFVITGEVLGQRPMSQRRDTINIIEKESGLKGFIVRPLSAAHFAPSVPEQGGIIDRLKLLNITGRSRAVQYKLAEDYKLKEFGCPAGGCLLTDPIFSAKLKDLFRYDNEFSMTDIKLLNIGRHFRLRADTKLIIGRNKVENERICNLWSETYNLLLPSGFTGPSGIIKGNIDVDILNIAANIIGSFAKYSGKMISIEIKNRDSKIYTTEKILININDFKI